MDVTCDRCHTEYEFDDALVSDHGTSVRCTQCGHRFRVRRRDGGAAPEVWIVRTVDGQALEFRALRELKGAIAQGKVSRDDVLSRGGGRPRRLASIAELDPFFSSVAPPRATAQTQIGLGSLEGRQRSRTPPGLGVAPDGRHDQSIAIPLPGKDQRAGRIVVPPPTQSEPTVRRMVTRELVELAARGELDEPAQPSTPFDEEEETGVRDLLKTTRGAGTPLGVDAAEPATLPPKAPASTHDIGPIPPPPVPREGRTGDEKTTAVLSKEASALMAQASTAVPSFPPPSEDDPVTARRGAGPASSKRASRPDEAPPASSQRASRPDEAPPAAPERAAAPEPAAPAAPKPAPPPEAPSEPPASKRAPRSVRTRSDAPDPKTESNPPPTPQPGRASIATPMPGEARASRASIAEMRYSLTGEETSDRLSDRRTSVAESKRASGSTRLVVGLLVGGALAFLGVLAVQRFAAPGRTPGVSAPDERVKKLLEEGEKAFREGDLDGAKTQFDKASALGESDPSVAKALARLAVARADVAWLELRTVSADDPARGSLEKLARDAAESAQRDVDRAAMLAPKDPEVTRALIDVRRIRGDVAGARALVDAITSLSAQGETAFVLGALDLAEDAPPWASVVERLGKAADQEGQLGRARTMLVYALARSGDPGRAESELEKLAGHAKPHPLEGPLRKFVERARRGELGPMQVDALPPASASAAPTTSATGAVGGGLDTLQLAYEALSAGQNRKAEELFQQIHDREPNNSEALAGLAAVARANGATSRAMSLYQRVLDQNPNYVPAIINLADLKWSSGDRGSAAALYRRALQMGIGGANADRARERAGQAEPPPPPPPTGDPTPTGTGDPSPPPTTTGDPPPPPGDAPLQFTGDPPPAPEPAPPSPDAPPRDL